LRTVVHNNIERVLTDFVKDAGMINVHVGPREWDADMEGSDDHADDNHRRPDIVCTRPLTSQWYVLDERSPTGEGL
jgi:hypothetical protein